MPRRRLPARPHSLRVGLSTVILIAVAACGGPAGTAAPPEATFVASPGTAPTARPSSASLTPSSAITHPAPRELQGTWTATLDGARVALTIHPGAYVIQRFGEGGGGKLAVTGHQLELSDSSVCQPPGTYRWDVADEELTLTVVGKDPCRRRAEMLDGIHYQLTIPPS